MKNQSRLDGLAKLTTARAERAASSLEEFDRELSQFLTPEPKKKKALFLVGEDVIGSRGNIHTPNLNPYGVPKFRAVHNLGLNSNDFKDARRSALADADEWINNQLIVSDGGPLDGTIRI